jgi:MFS family permease
MLGDTVSTLLSSPLIATTLGLVCGALIALANRYSARFMTPDDASGAGMGVALGTYLVGFLVAAGLLFGYWAVAPEGLLWFGIALVGSILVVTVGALIPAMREMRSGDKGR